MEQPENVTLRDYTEAFKVRRAMRKIGKAHIPLKEGLFVDDLKVFGISLVCWIFGYNLVLRPPLKFLLGLVGAGPPVGVPYLMLVFLPPILAVAMSRRPLRHGLLLFGLVRAVLRDLLDDPVHRKGVPVKRGEGAAQYRVVLWRARPDLVAAFAAREPLPNGFTTVPPVRTTLAAAGGGAERPEKAAPEATATDRPDRAALPYLSDDELAADFVITSRRT